MKRHTCILFFFAVLSLSCTNKTRMTEAFSQIEQLIEEAPDSSLSLLRSMPVESWNKRATCARYALLYAEAVDRAGVVEENCDSMLHIAWLYYRNRPHEIPYLCKTLYYQGRSKLRQGDKPGALRLFLDVEEQLRTIDEPYYLGLLYLRIGEVYQAELNFVRAYRYYRDARDLFMRTENIRQTTEALLGMTISALQMRDLGRARRDCMLALELADELQDDALIKRTLACIATLYTISDKEQIPADLLLRVERSARGDTTTMGLCVQAQTQLFRNHFDRADCYLRLAEEQASDSDDLSMLLFTAYRVDVSAGRYQDAMQHIRLFFFGMILLLGRHCRLRPG